MTDFGWGGHAEMQEIESRLRRAHLTSIRARLRLQERVDHLEAELAWVRVLASAFAGLCIEKGVVTADEVRDRIARLESPGGVPDAAAQNDDVSRPPPQDPAPSPSPRRRRSRLRR